MNCTNKTENNTFFAQHVQSNWQQHRCVRFWQSSEHPKPSQPPDGGRRYEHLGRGGAQHSRFQVGDGAELPTPAIIEKGGPWGVFFRRPKPATNILENGLFDLPRFYERVLGCSVRPKNAKKTSSKTLFFDFRDFSRSRVLLGSFCRERGSFWQGRNSDFAMSK